MGGSGVCQPPKPEFNVVLGGCQRLVEPFLQDYIPEMLCHLFWGVQAGRESVLEPATQGIGNGIEGDGIICCLEMDV